MKSKLLLLLTLLVSAFSWGQTATYTVATTTSVTTGGTIPLGSTASYSQTFGTAKQITSGNSATLTLSGYTGKKITSIVLEMRSNASAGVGTLNVTAGSTSIASVSPTAAFNTASWYGAWSSSYVNVTKTPSAYSIGTGENVVIYIAGTTNSIYIQKYTIVYEDACTDPELAFGVSSITKNDTDANFTNALTTPLTSAGAITYSSSDTGVATVNSTTGEVDIVGAGTATITASQAANGSYCADTATYSLTVNSTSPTITLSAGSITAMTTTYGTVSTNQCFTFTGSNLTGSTVTVTVPSGFEVATSSGGTYATSQTYTITSGNVSGSVCVRLANNTPAGTTYNGNITLSDGTTTATRVIPNSTVNPKSLTVTGLTGVNKIYDGNTSTTLSGTPTLTGGILFSDDVTLSGTGTSNFADKNVGTAKIITTTGYTLSGTKASNYSLTQPTATADITAKALSISAPTIATKVYNGSAVSGAVTPGTVSGLIGIETLNITATGLYSDANAEIGKTATVTYLRANGTNGGLANNYSLASGTGTGDITKANPTFNPLTINLSIGGTQTITSTSDGVLSFTSDNATIATVGASSGLVTGVAAGTTNINVSQAASLNYNIGNATVSVVVSAVAYNHGDYRTKSSGTWSYNVTTPGTTQWEQYSSTLGWQDYVGQPTAATEYTAYITLNTEIPTNATAHGKAKIVVTKDDVTGMHATLVFNPSANWTFRNVIIENGATLEVKTVGFNVLAGRDFEIKDGGNFIFNYSSTAAAGLTASLWNGVEVFHVASNFIVKNHETGSGKYFLPPAANLSSNTYNGVAAYFGNLIFESVGDVFLTTTNLSGTGTYLTHGNFQITSPANYRLIHGNGTWVVGGDLIINGPITTTTGANTIVLNVKGDFIRGGTGTYRLLNNNTANVTLNIDGNAAINTGTLDLNYTSGGSGTINLKGDLFVSSSAQLLANNGTTATFNFTGTGNGTTDALTQTIDVANAATASNIAFNVNSGAYAKLINQDFALGTNSTFTVKTGGTFDFGFKNLTNPNADTSLSLIRVSGQINQIFELQDGGTLKITSPYGINTGGDYTGNVKIGSSTTNRVFSLNAIYHYIGREYNEFGFEFDQVSGVGLPGTTGNKTVIVELENNDIFFRATGIKWFNTGYGLEIRRGIVVDDNTNRFDNDVQNGTLKMTGGTYKILTSGIDSSSATYTQPGLSGSYDLSTGSKIIFAHTSATTTVQGIRGGSSYQYPEIQVTGEDVYHSSNGNINMKANGLFTVKENAILTSTGANAQIVSLDDANPAALTIENDGRFKTEREKGFSGVPDGIDPAPSVRTSHTTGNVLVVLQPGSIVEYSRTDDQTITHTNFGTTLNPYSYQNLHISGSGNKTLQHDTDTRVNEDLEVLAGNTATLLVEEGKVITVKQAVKVPSTVGDAKFEIKDNGQLIQIDDLANTGTNFFMERKATVTTNDYVYWSSPTDDFSVTLIPNSGLRYEWNPIKYNNNGTQGNWINASSSMSKGKGYIVRVPNPTPTDTTTIFKGTPRNGTVAVKIFRGSRTSPGTNVTEFDDNWNLVGNPYPSAISALEFLQTNGANLIDTNPPASPPTIVGAVWVWKHGIDLSSGNQDPFYYNFANNYSSTDYIKFNGTGSTDPSFDGFIGAGQGFMISMKDNAFGEVATDISGNPEASLLINDFVPYENKVVFTNSMRVNDSGGHYDNNQFFRTANAENSVAADDEKHRIWLDIIKTSNGQTDTALIGYISNATMSEDNLYDTFFVPRSEVSLYSLINTKSYIIQGRSLPFENTDLVPLGMKIISAGNHTIAIRQVDGIFEGNQNIYLEDKQLNIIHDLKQSPYHFTAPVGINNTRFVLRYTTNALGNTDFDYDNQIVISSKNNTVTINSTIQNIEEVQVYDVLGRQLYQNKSIENQLHSFTKNIAKQTIIVKVKLQNGIWITKKVLLN